MKKQKKYNAFSLIELLVSIVVLGIVVVTVPVVLNTFTSSAKVSVKESVFFNEFTLLSLISSKYWDENNTKGNNFYKDLNATQGCPQLQVLSFSNGDLNRIGKEEMNNYLIKNGFKGWLRSGSSDTPSAIGPDTNENEVGLFDDIDDFNNYEENISVGVTSKGYTLKVNVGYIDDEANYSAKNLVKDFNYAFINHNTNIKLIKITTTFEDGSKIVLVYPSCNVGASKFYSLQDIWSNK